MARREQVFATNLRHELETRLGAWVYKVPDMPRFHGARFNPMKPVDLLGVMPGGRMLAIECKQQRGFASIKKDLLRESQIVTLDAVEDRGGLAYLAVHVCNRRRGHARISRLYVFRWSALRGRLALGAISPAELRSLPYSSESGGTFPGLFYLIEKTLAE